MRLGTASPPLQCFPSGDTRWNDLNLSAGAMVASIPDLSASTSEANPRRCLASRNSTNFLNLTHGPQSSS